MSPFSRWYEQRILDRPPVRFHHHNVEYERRRTVAGPWKDRRQRWMDVEFQVKTFVDSLRGARFLGETFPVFWPNLSAVAYNLFLGQPADFDDVTAWTHPWIDDLGRLPPLRVQWDGEYFRTVEALTDRALELAEGRFLVGYTDMYAGIDCTAGLRGTERMCLDLVTDPQGILRLIDRAFAEYPAVYAHFDRKLKAHDQLSVTWMNLPSFGTFNVLACDFAVNISRQHFDEVLPADHPAGGRTVRAQRVPHGRPGRGQEPRFDPHAAQSCGHPVGAGRRQEPAHSPMDSADPEDPGGRQERDRRSPAGRT